MGKSLPSRDYRRAGEVLGAVMVTVGGGGALAKWAVAAAGTDLWSSDLFVALVVVTGIGALMLVLAVLDLVPHRSGTHVPQPPMEQAGTPISRRIARQMAETVEFGLAAPARQAAAGSKPRDDEGELFDNLFPLVRGGLDILNRRNSAVESDLADRAAERWIDRVRELTEGGYPEFALYFAIPEGRQGRPRHHGQCVRLHELVSRLNFFLGDLKALRITYASYGAGTKTMNPRDRLNGLIVDDRLNFIVDDATMGDDPAPEEEKRLILRWVQAGEERDSSFKVGTHVGLPSRQEAKLAGDGTEPGPRTVASPVARDIARRFRGAVEAGLTHADRETVAQFGDELADFWAEREHSRPPEEGEAVGDHDAETVRLYQERYATRAIEAVREARDLGFLSADSAKLAREPFRTNDIATLAARLRGLRPTR